MTQKGNIIKELNLNKVRSALKDAGTATKPQLAEITGLSVVTINSLVNTLLDAGELLTDTILNSDGGRPAASFRYNSKFRLALTIFMHEYKGQDTAFYCVSDLRGEVIERTEQNLSSVNVDSFDSVIENLLCKYPQIKVICFGIPGEEVNQRLVISDYEKLKEQSLSGHILEKFHLPVHIENDINAAVMGYCHHNNIPTNKCIIGLYFPGKYPPGAGIYLNGHIYKGRDGLAGEIKYLPFGIDWESFDYNPADMENIMLKTIQAFQCMFNPDAIVLYGEKTTDSISRIFQEKSLTTIEKIMLPEIITSTDLNTDFEAGIRQLALKIIDTCC